MIEVSISSAWVPVFSLRTAASAAPPACTMSVKRIRIPSPASASAAAFSGRAVETPVLRT